MSLNNRSSYSRGRYNETFSTPSFSPRQMEQLYSTRGRERSVTASSYYPSQSRGRSSSRIDDQRARSLAPGSAESTGSQPSRPYSGRSPDIKDYPPNSFNAQRGSYSPSKSRVHSEERGRSILRSGYPSRHTSRSPSGGLFVLEDIEPSRLRSNAGTASHYESRLYRRSEEHTSELQSHS